MGRRSDGRVAHLFRLVSTNLEEAVRESEASDADNAAETGFQELFRGHKIHDIIFTCAPPKLDDISPQAMHAGAAWLVKASVASDGTANNRGIQIDLQTFYFLSRESFDGGL